MKYYKAVNLVPYTYFRVDGGNPPMYVVETAEDLRNIPPNSFVLGGGSNVLFVGKSPHPVVRLGLEPYIRVVKNTPNHTLVAVSASVVWDNFVKWALSKELYGIENLSFIPGTVGASVVQNIGAFGVEVKDVVYLVRAYDRKTQKFVEFTNQDCKFAYRMSVFKRNKARFVVWEVVYKLSKEFVPVLTYKDLQSLEKDKSLTAAKLRKIIGSLRSQKLPNPQEEPNAGSFFVNPVVSKQVVESIKKEFPNVPHFEVEGGYKVPAGWLIDKAGLKGRVYGKAKVSEKNALVLVNLGDPTGYDVYELSRLVQATVLKRFGVELRPEVVIIKSESK